MFQSLTGRLKTVMVIVSMVYVDLFQSLTGRLKTWFVFDLGACSLLFQSLTGRLKTGTMMTFADYDRIVSIPHR